MSQETFRLWRGYSRKPQEALLNTLLRATAYVFTQFAVPVEITNEMALQQIAEMGHTV
jgi:hypothetical protein